MPNWCRNMPIVTGDEPDVTQFRDSSHCADGGVISLELAVPAPADLTSNDWQPWAYDLGN